MPNKLLPFFLFFLLNINVAAANVIVGPYCNNIIDQNKLHQIDNNPPQVIEVEINDDTKKVSGDGLYQEYTAGKMHRAFIRDEDGNLSVNHSSFVSCYYSNDKAILHSTSDL